MDLNKCLKVIDLLRGEQICLICQRLCPQYNGKPRFDPATLDAEQLQRHKQTALRWANAMDPEIRAEAVKLGLDIGGLGTDIRKKTPDLDKMDLEAIAAEAVEWYDTTYKGTDPNAAR